MSFKTFDIGAPVAGRLGEALGTGLKSGFESLQKRLIEQEKQQSKEVTPQQAAQLTQTLIQQGMDPRLAKLYPYLTTGGQTKAGEFGVEEIYRQLGIQEPGALTGVPTNQDKSLQESFIEEGPTGNEELFSETEKYIERNFKNRTPKEIIKRKDDIFKENEKALQEFNTKFQSANLDKLRINRLKELNKSDKLPTGAERIFNVDFETGRLRIPSLSSDEAQEYAKIINDFTRGAKDSYGARITNFELGVFMSRLPTLLNTPGARERVLEQMSIMNEMDSIVKESIRNIFDKYGQDNISFSQAETLALRSNKDKLEPLEKKYVNLDNSLKKDFEAEQFKNIPKGAIRKSKNTGQRQVWTGSKWKVIK